MTNKDNKSIDFINKLSLSTVDINLKKEAEICKLRSTVSDLQKLCQERRQDLEESEDKLTELSQSFEERECSIRELSDKIKELTLENTKLKKELIEKYSIKDSKEYKELRQRLNSVFIDIRTLNKELRESNDNYDSLEIAFNKLNKEILSMNELHDAELSLMKLRINDLTTKLTNSERNLKQAKQRITKFEARQERRRSSLKGKEEEYLVFQIGLKRH